jgi:DNA-binding NtrC family response regulator
MDKLKILIVDDDQWVREELDEFLTENEYTVFQAGLPSEAFRIAEAHEPDIVLLDIKLPEMDGLAVLERLKASFPEMEIMMITGHGDMNSVIQAMRLGASDYLTKPFRLPEVQATIERTQKFILLHQKLKMVELNYSTLSQEFRDSLGYHIIGKSPAMKAVLELMSKVAGANETSVLIIGESGTGKELIARGIHRLSARKDHMFCPVNTSAITDTLFESEFFGHKKGSFTGASKDKAGWFQVAYGGTLFLDEISTMPLHHQAKLLRVLEEKTITRVGSHTEIPVDVRIIAATNRDIEQLVNENTFREDLYYRLSAFTIPVPPLRQRKEDIPLLLENFVSHYSRKINKPVKKVDKQVTEALMAYNFPGNIRELKNMVERAVILCDGDTLYLQHFPIFRSESLSPLGYSPEGKEHGLHLEKTLELTEKRLILQALEKANYNKSKAAELLNISRQSLHRRLNRLGLSGNRALLSE